MRKAGTVRAASLSHFQALADESGLESARLLAAVGLDEALLRHPDQRVSITAVSALLELAAAEASNASLRIGNSTA